MVWQRDKKSCRQSAAALGLVVVSPSRTFSEILSQFLREPLDGPHAQLSAQVSVEGRRRPSLQRKDNSWTNESKKTLRDACVEAVPAGGDPARWLCSRRCPSPPMNTACGWSLLCSFHGIFHSCGGTANEKVEWSDISVILTLFSDAVCLESGRLLFCFVNINHSDTTKEKLQARKGNPKCQMVSTSGQQILWLQRNSPSFLPPSAGELTLISTPSCAKRLKR